MAEKIDFSTDAVPEAERFELLREAANGMLGIVNEPILGAPATLGAQFSYRIKGPLQSYLRISDPTHVRCGQRELAERPWNCYAIYRELSPGAWFDINGREFVSDSTTMIIADGDQPFQIRPIANFHRGQCRVPLSCLCGSE